MKILAISDIHYPDRLNEIPDLSIYARDIDAIFALGDYTTLPVLNYLKSFNKHLFAVYGNMDNALLKKQLPDKVAFEINNTTVGLFHGTGGPHGIEKRVKATFERSLDAYIFGHSHIPVNKTINNALYFNPGALCNPHPSLGFIYIDFKNIWGEIIYLPSHTNTTH